MPAAAAGTEQKRKLIRLKPQEREDPGVALPDRCPVRLLEDGPLLRKPAGFGGGTQGGHQQRRLPLRRRQDCARTQGTL